MLNKLVLPLCLMKIVNVDDALDLMVFLVPALSLVMILRSPMLLPFSIFFSGWRLFSWSWSFSSKTNLGIIVIILEGKVGVWSSFYWPAIFKMIWTNLDVFAYLKRFLLSRWIYGTLFTSFVQVFTLFSFFGEKQRIDLILKYVVLWHNDLNVDGYYHIPKKLVSIYEVNTQGQLPSQLKRKRIH